MIGSKYLVYCRANETILKNCMFHQESRKFVEKYQKQRGLKMFQSCPSFHSLNMSSCQWPPSLSQSEWSRKIAGWSVWRHQWSGMLQHFLKVSPEAKMKMLTEPLQSSLQCQPPLPVSLSSSRTPGSLRLHPQWRSSARWRSQMTSWTRQICCRIFIPSYSREYRSKYSMRHKVCWQQILLTKFLMISTTMDFLAR